MYLFPDCISLRRYVYDGDSTQPSGRSGTYAGHCGRHRLTRSQVMKREKRMNDNGSMPPFVFGPLTINSPDHASIYSRRLIYDP